MQNSTKERAMSEAVTLPLTVGPRTVGLSAAAAKRISEIATAEGRPTCLRISVEGGGCSGFQYKFVLAAEPASDDTVIARDGARLLIDPMTLDYMAGSEVDYVDDLIGASFKIKNPNATSACGCGTSFGV